jgi:subfamily B ATP-binding cassette protein MsbA
MLMLVSPIKRLADIATPITRGLAALERGLRLLEDVQIETEGSSSLQNGAPNSGTEQPDSEQIIEFQNIDVRYTSDASPAVKNLNLRIQAGETVAFVGTSGSGKTTLVNLLPRFVQASAGKVLLHGIPVQEWPLNELRQQFAMVSQDVIMLNDSVAANVALGQSIDRNKIADCLKAANLAEYVGKLPQGIDTVLGHNASELSGGQRQRLAIARALYKNAPILILDEATSALDNESERWVQEALQNLMKGRTTLIIAHRLSTIEHADRVIVMSKGEIVEQGRHDELLKAGGTYSRLHSKGEAH